MRIAIVDEKQGDNSRDFKERSVQEQSREKTYKGERFRKAIIG